MGGSVFVGGNSRIAEFTILSCVSESDGGYALGFAVQGGNSKIE